MTADGRRCPGRRVTSETIPVVGVGALLRPRLRGVFHQAFFPVFVAATIVLVVLAGSALSRLAMGFYGLGLAACLGTSALYHRGRWSPAMRGLLGRIDHSMIFLLVAGTYTPVCLLVLSGAIAYIVLGIVWIGGALGAAMAMLWPRAPVWAEVTPYIVVGWAAALAFPQLAIGLGWGGLSLLVAGGLLYTAGAVIYGVQRPDPFPSIFGYHEIFHTLVVLAAAAHCVAVYVWVLPRSWS
jgi:hemolysin III